jgi:hypothetical protein
VLHEAAGLGSVLGGWEYSSYRGLGAVPAGVCVSMCMCAYMYVCMYVTLYVFMHVCVYVCNVICSCWIRGEVLQRCVFLQTWQARTARLTALPSLLLSNNVKAPDACVVILLSNNVTSS